MNTLVVLFSLTEIPTPTMKCRTPRYLVAGLNGESLSMRRSILLLGSSTDERMEISSPEKGELAMNEREISLGQPTTLVHNDRHFGRFEPIESGIFQITLARGITLDKPQHNHVVCPYCLTKHRPTHARTPPMVCDHQGCRVVIPALTLPWRNAPLTFHHSSPVARVA